MLNHKKINISKLYTFTGIILYIVLFVVAVNTQYPATIGYRLGGLAAYLSLVLSFLPSSLLFAYFYVKKEFNTYRVARTSVLGVAISMALTVPFGIVNLAVNLPK